VLMQGFLTTDGHEIYTDGFDRIDRRESKRSNELSRLLSAGPVITLQDDFS
jgi:hypothetical protein